MIRLFSSGVLLSLCLILGTPLAASGQALPDAAPAVAAPVATPALTPAPDAAATAAAPDPITYTLGLGDVIDVGVLGRTDFNARVRIASDGTVLLPYLGAIVAANRTPAQLADYLKGELEKGGFFFKPIVRVDVASVASRYVTVLGFVGAPGLVSLDRQYKLSEIIARVGGKSGGGADYVLLTREGGEAQKYMIADLATGVAGLDPTVNPGDKIFVPAAENEVFYVTGQVRSPGTFPAVANLTLRMALARGGGVTDMGSEKKVKIVRNGAEIKGVKLDTTIVQAGDVITVGERLF